MPALLFVIPSQNLIKERVDTERVLGSGFWLFVYDNYKAPREAIESYFRQQEYGDDMKTFPVKHRGGLDFLFARMKWVNAHPCAAFWWVFFDDLWEQNSQLNVLKDKKALFDSRASTSIAYHPMKQDEFTAKMESEGLRNVGGCRGSKKYFNDALIGLLYDHMNRLDREYQDGRKAAGQV